MNILNTPFVQNSVKFLKKNKDVLVIILVLFVLIPAIGGGKTNLDPKTGELLANRAITETSNWTFNGNLMDFLFVIPIGKGIIYFSNVFNSPIIALGIVAIIIQIILWFVNHKSNIDAYKMQLIQRELDKKIKTNNIELLKFLDGRKKDELTNEERKEYNKLKDTYDKEIEKHQKELYEKNGIKTHFQTLSTVIQLVVLMGVYYAAQRTQIIYDYSFFDINLSVKLAEGMHQSYQYILLLFTMIATQFISQNLGDILNLNKKDKADENKEHPSKADVLTKQIMRVVNCLMIGFIALIGMQFPTVLTVYWIMSSIIGMIKSLIERKFLKNVEITL